MSNLQLYIPKNKYKAVSKQTILELDINVESLVKRAADVQKKIEELSAKTAAYRKSIKDTNKIILSEREALSELAKQGKRNSTEYEERRKRIEELEKANDKNRQSSVEVNSELKKSQAEFRIAQKTVMAYNKSLDKQLGIVTKTDGSINQISAALSANKKAYKSLTKEQRENEAIGGRLNKLIKEQDAEYKELHKSIGNNNVDVGNYKGQIGELMDKFTGSKIPISQFSGGLKNVMGNIKGMTKAALSFIATPLGAAIAAVALISNGVKEWFEFNLEIEKTNKLVRDLTQQTGTAVDAIRIRAEILKDSFGVEVKEGIEVAKSMVENFGISYDKAFDLIENSAVKGKLRNGEFIDSIKEYPIQFKNAGFSAEEFVGILEKGVDMSIYQDKLPDAIKEFGLAITEETKGVVGVMEFTFGKDFSKKIFDGLKRGSITVKDALAQISAETKRVGVNSQQAQLLTAELFKGAGEDAGGALKIFEAVNKALNEEQKPLTEIQKLKNKELETTKELQGVYKQLFAANSEGMGLLIEKGKIFAKETLLNILKKGVDLYNWFVEMNNTSTVFSATLTFIGKAASASFEALGILISGAIENFKALGNVIKGVFTLDWDTFSKGLEQGINNIGSTIGKFKDKTVKDFNDIYDAFSGKNKMKKITLSAITADEVTENDSGFKTKGKLTSTDKIVGGKKKDKKDEKSNEKNNELDELIKQQKAQLDLYIAQNESKQKSLSKLIEFEEEANKKRIAIEDTRLKNSEVSQAEYNLNVLNSKREMLRNIAQATIENANKELEIYQAENLSKIQEDKALTQEMVNSEVERLQTINQKRMEILDLQKQKELISEQEYKLQKLQLESEFLEQKKTVQDEFKQQQLEAEQIDFENELELKRLRGEAEYDLKIKELNKQEAAEVASAKKRGADVEKIHKKYAERKKKIEDESVKAQLTSLASRFNSIKQIFGESSKVGKAAAIAEATINTHKAATAAMAALSSIPVVGPVKGIAAAAAAIAAGMAHVRTIASISTKFQKGGLLRGKSHAQGGIPFSINGAQGFEAEGGEYIVNKKATQQFLPLLEHINSKYNFGNPNKYVFQNGGVLTSKSYVDTSVSIDYEKMAEHIGNRVAEANRNLPRPVVAVEDINTAQEDCAEIVSAANEY